MTEVCERGKCRCGNPWCEAKLPAMPPPEDRGDLRKLNLPRVYDVYMSTGLPFQVATREEALRLAHAATDTRVPYIIENIKGADGRYSVGESWPVYKATRYLRRKVR